MGRKYSKRDWLWEEVAALKRGRPEPETPPGEEEMAETARAVGDALAASADPERQALSRERLLAALRDEGPLPRGVVAPTIARTPLAAVPEMLLSAAVVLAVGLAGWYLPAWGSQIGAKESAPATHRRAPDWQNSLYVGSFRVLATDRNLREEFGGARGLLRPN